VPCHAECTKELRKDAHRGPHFSSDRQSVCTYRRASARRRASSRSLLISFTSGGAQTNWVRRRSTRFGRTFAKHRSSNSNIPISAVTSSSRCFSSKDSRKPSHLDRQSMRSCRIFSRSTAERYSPNHRWSTLYFEIARTIALSWRESSDVRTRWKRRGYRSTDKFLRSRCRSVRMMSLKRSQSRIPCKS
jgi:hypothetical protein